MSQPSLLFLRLAQQLDLLALTLADTAYDDTHQLGAFNRGLQAGAVLMVDLVGLNWFPSAWPTDQHTADAEVLWNMVLCHCRRPIAVGLLLSAPNYSL